MLAVSSIFIYFLLKRISGTSVGVQHNATHKMFSTQIHALYYYHYNILQYTTT